MADEAGFLIDGEVYPITTDFTIGDSVLVRMVGGLDMEDFGEGLAEGQMWSDARVLACMVGTAVWRRHPRWSLDRVTRFVHQIDMVKLGLEAGEVAAEEEVGDASPPALTPPTPLEPGSPNTKNADGPSTDVTSSPPSSESSTGGGDVTDGAGSGSDGTPPSRSGSPVSHITSAASALGS